jgi:hypothetical protein
MPGYEAGTLYKAFVMKAEERAGTGPRIRDYEGGSKASIPFLREIQNRFPTVSGRSTGADKEGVGSRGVKLVLQLAAGMDTLQQNFVSVRRP